MNSIKSLQIYWLEMREKGLIKIRINIFSYAEKDDYSLCFQNLCEITIDKNTEYLGNRIREKTINDDYTLKNHIIKERKIEHMNLINNKKKTINTIEGNVAVIANSRFR